MSAIDALIPGSRQAVLGLLYGHPTDRFYLRELVRLTGLGPGQVQREVERLERGGIIVRLEEGRHVYFQADPTCPVYAELRSLIAKTVGAIAQLKTALDPLAERIGVAFIFGSVARGEEGRASDLDCLVVGDVSFAEVVDAIREPEKELRCEINPVVYSREELRARHVDGNHFVEAVLSGPKTFLIGGADELGELETWLCENHRELLPRV